MSDITLKDKIVKIRKARQCFTCYRHFTEGITMRYWSGVIEGDFASTFNCEECSTIIDLCPPDDEIPSGYVHEMLKKGQTVSELIQQLIEQQNERTI